MTLIEKPDGSGPMTTAAETAPKLTKGQTVFYSIGAGTSVRATVERVGRDGSVIVLALFFVDKNSRNVPGYLGFKYRIDAKDLRLAA